MSVDEEERARSSDLANVVQHSASRTTKGFEDRANRVDKVLQHNHLVNALLCGVGARLGRNYDKLES